MSWIEDYPFNASTSQFTLPAKTDVSQMRTFNVLFYGALGQGGDDTAAINAAGAAAAAAGGGVLWFPPGVYGVGKDNLTTLSLYGNNIVFQGSGMGATTLRLLSTTGNNMALINDSVARTNVTVQDLTIDMNGNGNASSNGIYLNATGLTNVHIRRCQFIGNNGARRALSIGYPVSAVLSANFTVPASGNPGTLTVSSVVGTGMTVGSTVVIPNGANPFIGVAQLISGTSVTVIARAPGAGGDGSVIGPGTLCMFLSSDCSIEDCIFDSNLCNTFAACEAYSHYGLIVSRNVFRNNRCLSIGPAALFLYGYHHAGSVVGNAFLENLNGDILIQQGTSIHISGNTHRHGDTTLGAYALGVLNSRRIHFVGNTIQGAGADNAASIGVQVTDYIESTFDGNPTLWYTSDSLVVEANTFDSVGYALQAPGKTDSDKSSSMTNIVFRDNTLSNLGNAGVLINGNGRTGVTATMTATTYNVPAVGSSGTINLTAAPPSQFAVNAYITIPNGANAFYGQITAVAGSTITVTTVATGTGATIPGSSTVTWVNGASGMAGIVIDGNVFATPTGLGSQAAIQIIGNPVSAANGGILDVSIKGNRIPTGITGQVYGNGISLQNSLGTVSVEGNDFSGCANPIALSGYPNVGAATTAQSNPGYNPHGYVSAPAVGASPFTFPVVPYPATYFLVTAAASGISAIALAGRLLGGVNIGASTLFPISVGAGETLTITYTGTVTAQLFGL